MEPWTPDVVVLPDGFGTSGIGVPFPRIWGADRTLVDSLDESQESLRREEADLLVVLRSLPVPDPTPYEQLAEAAGDTELVQYLGPWCEGEERTGVTLEGFERVFWHAWPNWWRRWLADYRGLRSDSGLLNGATIAVAADADASQAIGAVLAESGACVAPLGVTRCAPLLLGRPAAIVWNGSQLSGLEAERLRAWCDYARERKSPLIALLDFPRPETVAAARAIGAAAVLGKPCDGDLLRGAIEEMIADRRRVRSPASSTSSSVDDAIEPPRAAA